MSKVDIKRLDSVTKNDTTATKQINDNFQALQAAIENTMSRDGTVPNYMDADLDLNSYRIINAGDPVGERDVITLKYFEEKAGGAIEAASEAKASASKAASSAQSALVASNKAIGQLAQAEGLLTTTEQYVDAAKADINTAVSNAESNISTIVSDAEGSITNIAVTEAKKAIANAAQEATDIATANVTSYVDGTVKPSLQTYVNQAQEDSNSAATSMEQAALSATAASNYASNASAYADNAANSAGLAANSAGLAANSAAAAKVSETNAKASETNVDNKKAEVEAIAKLVSFGNIGDIKYTSRTDVPNGGAWCNGALYTKAQFPDVYQMLVDGKLQSTTVSAFDNLVSANGSCGFFGLDTANERFKVPMLKDVYLKAGQAPSMFGAESLPNIKGKWTGTLIEGRNPAPKGSGAFSNMVDTTSGSYFGGNFMNSPNWNITLNGGEGYTQIDFNASRSSSTYQDNAKVNPDHVVYRAYVVLYSSAAEASVVQLANKANVEMDNLSASGKSLVSGWGMPSTRYIDLTLGASGSTYTAPANGWFHINGGSKSGNKWVNISNGICSMASISISGVYNAKVLYPVKKGDIVTVSYTLDTDNQMFRFIYAEGEN